MFRYLHAMAESRWCVPGLAVSGTILRLLLIWYIHGHGGTAFSDEVDYDHIAQSVSSGRGYIQFGDHFTAYRAPGQPLLLALLFHLIGHHPLVAKILEAMMLAIVPFLCAAAGRALGLSTVASNVGAALATFHPGLVYASATIYPTVLTVCGLTLGLLLCSEVITKPDVRKSIVAGLSLGLAGSATTTFAPIAFLASLAMLWKRRYRDAIVVLVLGTLPVIVWMARNKEVMGQFTLATNGGYNLFLGANDGATPMSGNWVDPHLPNEYDRGELADDETYRTLAVAWIKAHPGRWVALAAARSILVVDSVGNARTQGLHSGLLGHIAGWLMLPVILLGLVGLVQSYRQPLAWLTGLALLLILFSSASTIVKPRFRFPCDPLLCEFAVAGFLTARSKIPHKTTTDRKPQHSQVSLVD